MPRATDLSDEESIEDMPSRGALAKTEVDIQAKEQLDNELVDDIEETAETSKKELMAGADEDEHKEDEASDVEDGEDGADEGDGDADDDEEAYVVQKIVGHDFVGKQVRYKVRWVGYKAADDTWEPENNLLPGAAEALAKYHEKEGGVPQPPRNITKSKSTSDVKRSRSTDSPPSSKRQRRTNGEETWTPKGQNWEDQIERINTIEPQDNDELMVYIEFKNGKQTKVNMNMVYKHCPIAMLKFYEKHVKFNGSS